MTKIMLLQIFSVLTLLASYAIKLIGFPEQIQKIRKAKSANGISKTLFITSFVSFILWTIYGYLKNDWVIFYGQGLGVIVSAILLFYLWKYRK
jgi:uncharacterized protein with PQ loop repeat